MSLLIPIGRNKSRTGPSVKVERAPPSGECRMSRVGRTERSHVMTFPRQLENTIKEKTGG